MKRSAIVVLSVVVAVAGTKVYALEFVSNGWASVQLPVEQSPTAETGPGVGIGADVAASARWVELGVGVQNLFGPSAVFSHHGNFLDFFVSLRFPIDMGPMTLYWLRRIGYGLASADGTPGWVGGSWGGLFYSAGLGFRTLLFGRTFLLVEGTYDRNVGFSSLYSAVNLYMGLGGSF
jgi:hypothetical protein